MVSTRMLLAAAAAAILHQAAAAIPLECRAASDAPNWATYHVMNAVTLPNATHHQGDDCIGAPGLCVEHLNDANAIFEYRGIYHAMNQGGFKVNGTGMVNWTHAVSNDLVRWFRVKDAVAHDRQGACDGTVSFPGGVFGTAPVLMYGPDCADPDGFPHAAGAVAAGGVASSSSPSPSPLGDFPRVGVALPADPTSPHLLDWVKGPTNVSFSNGSTPSEPCSFPGKVWRSSSGGSSSRSSSSGGGAEQPNTTTWNMLCSPHWTGNWGSSWARYTSTDPALQTWTLADAQFITHDDGPSTPPGWHVDAASGAMFNAIPNADVAGGGPTHLINGNTGQAFWVGKYDAVAEKFRIGGGDALHWIDIGGGGDGFSGGAAHWAATSNSFGERPVGADNRLLWVAWVSSMGRGNADVLSLVRTISWDRTAHALISYPVPEYAALRNATFLSGVDLGTLAPGATKTLDAVPAAAGGALDLLMSFDLSALPAGDGASHFGVALRAPAVAPGGNVSDTLAVAAQNVWFVVSAADPASGARNVTVAGVMNGPGPPAAPKPNPCNRGVCPDNTTRLFPGEMLDVRVLVDRPVTEVFVLGGRVAFVHQDNTFDARKTSVHVYNSGESAFVRASNVSVFGMGCGWRDDLPQPREGAQ